MNTNGKRAYGITDLTNMVIHAMAAIIGCQPATIETIADNIINTITNKMTIITARTKNIATIAGQWAITILFIVGIAPAAALYGLIIISREILQSRHQLFEPREEPSSTSTHQESTAIHQLELPPIDLYEPQANDPFLASPWPSLASEAPETAPEPLEHQKAKKKARKRPDGASTPTKRPDGASTRYRRKQKNGNVHYVEAKRRVGDEVLYYKSEEGYIPVAGTLPVDLPALAS